VPRSIPLRAAFLASFLLALAGPAPGVSAAESVEIVPAAPPEARVAPAPALDPVPGPALTGALAAPDVAVPVPDLPPPDLPAPVVITAAEQAAALIQARLADPRFVLGPRLARREREAIVAFYALGGFAPFLVGEHGLTPAGRGIAGRLAAADEDALDPRAYPVPALPDGLGAAGLADGELRLAAAAVLYARDARGGRIAPSALPKLAAPKLDLPAADAVLTRLAGAGPAAGVALQAYNPAHAGYRLMRTRLAALRSARVAAADAEAWPSSVAKTAKRSSAEADLIANMERWRWLPPELGARYVAVNIPEFRGRVMEDGHVVHDMRVIVGKPDSPTPVFSGTMTYAVVNPSWTLPPSILKNEFLPRLAKDPNYAARLGYQVVRRGNSISIRQPPGERNALGFIKFMFPNDYAVYLHDTPNRGLFSATKRAFSHGCVRVDQPFDLAETLLGSAWPEGRLKNLIGKGERSITLARPLPVHLTYFTLIAEGGALRHVADVYGYDARIKTALGL
jgi:L,D-transpeptidase YcbB